MASGVSFNTTITPPVDGVHFNSHNPTPPADELKVVLDRLGANPGTGSNYTSYFTTEWNGKKYDLSYTYNDGNQTHTLGFCQEDWLQIADALKAVWNARQAHFSVGRFDVDKGVWHQRTDANAQTQTFDLINDPNHSAVARRVKDLFANNVVKAQHFESKPNPPAPQPPTPNNNPPTPPPDPLDDPNPNPDPQDKPWYAKLKEGAAYVWDKFKSLLPGSSTPPAPNINNNP